MMTLSNSQRIQLQQFLEAEDRPEKTMGLAELQGFLYGVAAAPEEIEEQAWLPLVFDLSLERAQRESGEMLALIRHLYQDIEAQIQGDAVSLPAACQPAPLAQENWQQPTPFSAWCAGFMAAHDWLDEVWEAYLPEEMQSDLNSMMVILSFFASEALAQAYYQELEQVSLSFSEAAEQVISLHGEALREYARMGSAIRHTMARLHAEKPMPAASHKVGRNEPCPCGSGQKFKRCCGA